MYILFWLIFQVWQGCLYLCDYLIAHASQMEGKVILELGAGVGLASVVAARVAKKVLCTGTSMIFLNNIMLLSDPVTNYRLAGHAWSALPKWELLLPSPLANITAQLWRGTCDAGTLIHDHVTYLINEFWPDVPTLVRDIFLQSGSPLTGNSPKR